MQNAKDLKALGGYGTIGLEVVLSILFGLWIGTKLDDWLGTAPYMAVIWFAFGCAAAGRSIYRSWKTMQAAAKKEEQEEGNPAPLFPDEKSLAWQREEARRKAEEEAGSTTREGDAETSLDEEPGSTMNESAAGASPEEKAGSATNEGAAGASPEEEPGSATNEGAAETSLENAGEGANTKRPSGEGR